MQQTMGREKAKKNIVLFVIGVFISFAASVISSVGTFVDNPWLSLCVVGSIAGIILEIIAIICLRNVNKHYANALWCLILDLLLNVASIIITVITVVQGSVGGALDTVSTWLDIASSIAEAGIVVYFVLGTNALATENGKGMPILTKIIVLGYVVAFLLGLLFNLLGLIPSIGTNETVVLIFSIIVLVLYVIREVSYLCFLIRSLWRVK